MYTISNHVGRLVEIYIWSPVSLEETVRWARDHQAVIDAVVGPYVCFVDLVDATIFPPEIVNAYVSTMKSEPRLLRTGTLLNPSPTFGLQIQRMIREANHPDRKAFRAPEELVTWLGAVLEPAERTRLQALASRRLTGQFGPASAPVPSSPSRRGPA
jgi:hypothetical protein